MADTSSPSKLRITRLILLPAIISLAVTLLRLTGELMHWSSILFNRSAGGGGAIVGITWLPFFFGPYFAVKLWDKDHRPSSSGKAVGYALLGAVLLFAGTALIITRPSNFLAVVGLLLMAAAIVLQFVPWRALAKTLIAYAYTARVPVAIVMFFAMQGHWGTHYDATPPEGLPAAFWPRYLAVAIAPQLLMWVAYTIIVGILFGVGYVAIVRRKKPVETPGSRQAAGA